MSKYRTFSTVKNKGDVLFFLLVKLGLTLALIKISTAFVISKLHLRDSNMIQSIPSGSRIHKRISLFIIITRIGA